MPLDPDPAQPEALNSDVMEYVGRFYAGREHAPALAPRPPDGLIEALHAPPSEHGAPIESLLATLDRAVATGFDTAAGSFLSYIPAGGVHAGAIGAFLGAVINRYTAAAHASPGAVTLEQGVIEWMISLFEMPAGAAGVLLSGGSIANLTAIVAARTRLGSHRGYRRRTAAVDSDGRATADRPGRTPAGHLGRSSRWAQADDDRRHRRRHRFGIGRSAGALWLLPFGVGALLVRDRSALVEANHGSGAYMQDVPDGQPTRSGTPTVSNSPANRNSRSSSSARPAETTPPATSSIGSIGRASHTSPARRSTVGSPCDSPSSANERAARSSNASSRSSRTQRPVDATEARHHPRFGIMNRSRTSPPTSRPVLVARRTSRASSPAQRAGPLRCGVRRASGTRSARRHGLPRCKCPHRG